MELLIEDGSIAERITRIKPTHIATAYIGRNWSDYVDVSALESVVLSPTVGSSCAAIWDLIETLGWDKVHFLNQLHAKFYLSPKGAVLGSSNLSNNGLQGSGGLIEAAVAMNSMEHPNQLKRLKAWHRVLMELAGNSYPTVQSKRKQLKWLEWVQHQASMIDGYPNQGNPQTKAQKKGRDIADYDLDFKQEDIHILGWSYTMDHDEKQLRSQARQKNPRMSSKALDDTLENAQKYYISLDKHQHRIVQQGQWVLMWKAKEDNWEPRGNGDVDWLHVDCILKTTSKDEDADPHVAHEFRRMRKDEVPFVLTKSVKQAIRELLASGKFPELSPKDPRAAISLKIADKQVPAFIEALKKRVATAK